MNHIFKAIFSIFFSIIFSYQTTTVKGTVLDEKNNPINNVYIFSETGYTETNNDGKFIVLYKDKKEELIFNKIGYKNEKYSVESLLKKSSIIMKIESIQLEEVKISEISGNIKKEESSSDIHIYSNSDFKPGNIHFDDIIKKIPNLNYAGGTSRVRYFQIRGIGERSQYAGEGGPIYYVGTVIDDIDVSGIGMGFFIDDIKQIEIFQGPQSFSYGHNSMAGLINVKTTDPSRKSKANFKLTIGNDEFIKSSGSYNYTPLKNNLFINHFIHYSKQNGFMYNDFLNDYQNNKSEFYQKIKFLYNNNNFNSKLTLLQTNLNNGYDNWTPNNNSDTTYSNQPGNDSQILYALSLKNTFNINKNKFIHISSYLKSNMEHSYDSDWGNDIFWSNEPYNVEGWLYEYYQKELRKRTMFTQEIRHIYDISNNIKIASGIYYKKLQENDDAVGWILGGEDAGLESQFDIYNLAYYNEIKLNLNRLFFTFNIRMEKINIDYKSTHFHEYFDYYTYNTNYDTSYVNIDNNNNNLKGGKFSLLYKLNENNNIYITLSNGFKSGGINQNPRLSIENKIYKPEYNQNIDLGYRFKNNISSLNFTTFYMKRDDLQVSLSSQQDTSDPNSFYFYTSNASIGYNMGWNLDFKLMPTDDFESYFNMGILKTRIDSYSYTLDESTIIEFDKRESAHAPYYTISWGFTKYYPNFNFGFNVESKDKFYFSDSHNQKSEPYSISNIHFDYKLNSNTEISLWSKNIFNKKYATRGFYFGLEPPLYENKLYLSYGDPFTIGMTLNYKIK
ncbi:TonB-dependent receptor [bacterium]|nr:TonB-dependent receptor [bacterium]